MSSPIFGGLLAFAVGFAVSLVNYLISRAVIRNKPVLITAASVVRQIFAVGYLVLLYFLAPRLAWGLPALLIGGALGVTLPMLYFTFLLLRELRPSENNIEGKEDDTNG